MPTAAGIYCRISKDLADTLLGVARQEKDCRALAERKGWAVSGTYIDDDVSAYVAGKRPSYERLLGDLRSGAVDAVLVYDLDRLHRHPWELEEFFKIHDAQPFAMASVAGDYDLGTTDGQLMARIMGAVAKKESDDKSRRLRRKHDELAELGRWRGGPRPYGYDVERGEDGQSMKSGRLVVIEAEAEIIREMATRVIAGESIYALCKELNTRAVPSASGLLWHTSSLRRAVTNSVVAGKREHNGVLTPALWPAILDEPTWLRVRARIIDPSRTRTTVARFMLSGGVARCGRCDSPLYASRRKSGARTYSCIKSPDKRGCGGLVIAAEPLERLISEMLFIRCESPEFVDAVTAAGEIDAAAKSAVDEIARLEAKLIAYADDFDADRISHAEWMHLRGKNESRLAALVRQQSKLDRSSSVARYAGSTSLEAEWETATPDQKRAIVASLIERVVIRPATIRGRTFDARRVDDPVWRY